MECGRLNGAIEECGLLKEFEDDCYISKKIAHFMDLKHGSASKLFVYVAHVSGNKTDLVWV